MTVPEVFSDIRARLAKDADPDHAKGSRAFFKEEIDPWGVRTSALQPIVRQVYSIVKKWPAADRNKLCDALWRGKFEEGVLACHLYRRFARECGRCEFRLFEHWIDRYVHNWAHCDGVASWLLAACIENDPALRGELGVWTTSANRWKRRASIVSFLQEAKKGRSSGEILVMAQLLQHDTDVMVQKGVGWVLKEMYPRRPEDVVAFLNELTFPRRIVRYAAEKMTKMHRASLGIG